VITDNRATQRPNHYRRTAFEFAFKGSDHAATLSAVAGLIANDTRTRQGYLLLADTSGYTAFLTGTELEHAHEIIHELTTLIRDRLAPPMRPCCSKPTTLRRSPAWARSNATANTCWRRALPAHDRHRHRRGRHRQHWPPPLRRRSPPRSPPPPPPLPDQPALDKRSRILLVRRDRARIAPR
jgi:hypothetical protein